jgi:hypothetical protein
MDLKEFAAEHRLPLRRVRDDATDTIPGREGRSHIFEYGSGLLGVMLMPETGTSHRWRAARSAFISARMEICQNGDGEGTASFDPENSNQVRLALKYARVRPRRKVSENQRQRLRELGFKKNPGLVREQNDFDHAVERELTQ